MRQVLTISFLIYSTLLWGQKTVSTNPSSKAASFYSELFFIDSLKDFEVAGLYVTSNGFAGYRLSLDSDGTFLKTGFDCVSRAKVDSGQWQLKDTHMLLLTSANTTKTYFFFKLDNYYFIVPKHQKQKFIKDYRATKAQLKTAKLFIIDGKTYSLEYLIEFSLVKKYFAKELDDNTGT